MAKAVYVILGSDYNPALEEIKFVQDLIAQNYQVSIYSVDMKAPLESSSIVNNVSLFRKQMNLNANSINALVEEILAAEGTIDLMIVMDGLDFKEVTLGNVIKDIFEKKTPTYLIHFITPNYQCPIFNNKSITDQFDFSTLTLTTEPIYSSIAPYVKNHVLFKNVKIKIEKSNSNHYEQLNSFMDSPAFKAIFNSPEVVKQLIYQGLTAYICSQINLEMVTAQTSNLTKKMT